MNNLIKIPHVFFVFLVVLKITSLSKASDKIIYTAGVDHETVVIPYDVSKIKYVDIDANIRIVKNKYPNNPFFQLLGQPSLETNTPRTEPAIIKTTKKPTKKPTTIIKNNNNENNFIISPDNPFLKEFVNKQLLFDTTTDETVIKGIIDNIFTPKPMETTTERIQEIPNEKWAMYSYDYYNINPFLAQFLESLKRNESVIDNYAYDEYNNEKQIPSKQVTPPNFTTTSSTTTRRPRPSKLPIITPRPVKTTTSSIPTSSTKKEVAITPSSVPQATTTQKLFLSPSLEETLQKQAIAILNPDTRTRPPDEYEYFDFIMSSSLNYN